MDAAIESVKTLGQIAWGLWRIITLDHPVSALVLVLALAFGWFGYLYIELLDAIATPIVPH